MVSIHSQLLPNLDTIYSAITEHLLSSRPCVLKIQTNQKVINQSIALFYKASSNP